MNRVRKFILIILSVFLFALPGNAFSADESVLFTSVPPDALLAVDFSLSMKLTPYGETLYYKPSSGGCPGTSPSCSTSLSTTPANTFYGNYHATVAPCACNADMSSGPRYAASTDTSCVGPFNFTESGRLDCSREAIAKRAIFAMLDDNNSGSITSTGTNSDDISLNIRMGYMNFVGCTSTDDTGGNVSTGCIKLINPIGTAYSSIYCANSTSCTSWSGSGGLRGTSAAGYTPLGSMLREAKIYLDGHKASDPAAACRDKFVIFVTDGSDTISCQTNSGIEWDEIQYKRRRATVDRAKALADAGYKVFVIGFGADLPDFLKNTLNWAAYYGGTDNPLVSNTGNVSAYTPYAAPSNVPNPTACSTNSTTSCYKYECSSGTGITCPTPTLSTCTAGTANCYCPANSNDPGGFPVLSGGSLSYNGGLNGYAFIAANADELAAALNQAANIIRSARYSFTIASIATARLATENNLYEASFTPVEDEPFWLGRLKKYNINADGSIGTQEWDAGNVLVGTAASARNIKTCLSGTTLTDFTTSLPPITLGVNTTTRRDEIVGYIRGEAAFNQENWKLGDIWHSSPVVISTPNPSWDDERDANDAFSAFRSANLRTSLNGKRVILAGANDGQLHVFRTSDGAETFSFIPPNMLPKLQLIAHATHPTSLQHQFFVDGPITASNVWLGVGDGRNKSASDWKTMVVFGLGRGVGPNSQYLWSASPNCTPTSSTAPYGYSGTYSGSTPHYCGYYAFDFTNTLNPVYKWRLNPSSLDAPYLGDPWSKMVTGKVKIGANEKWVGFVGGGGCDYDCATRSCTGTKGRGFFVVDLDNGSILWSHTGTNAAIPAHPVIIDIDNDGFIDTAYVGDLGGNIWRFKFCTTNDPTSCNISNWNASLLYNGGGERIYTAVTVVKDAKKNLWVYWGTGDKQCPAITTATGRFYALKDGDAHKPLLNPTYVPTTYSTTVSPNGWSMPLSASGEKILAEPTVYEGEVFFTSYIPWVEGGDPCRRGGAGKLYVVNYATGALIGSVDLGIGIPSAPLLTFNPDKTRVDLHVTMSGGGGIDSRTFKPTLPGGSKLGQGSGSTIPRTEILFWRDRRVQ